MHLLFQRTINLLWTHDTFIQTLNESWFLINHMSPVLNVHLQLLNFRVLQLSSFLMISDFTHKLLIFCLQSLENLMLLLSLVVEKMNDVEEFFLKMITNFNRVINVFKVFECCHQVGNFGLMRFVLLIFNYQALSLFPSLWFLGSLLWLWTIWIWFSGWLCLDVYEKLWVFVRRFNIFLQI